MRITTEHGAIIYDEKREKKMSLLELLRSNGIYQNAPCNGMGRCGKCAIVVTKGTLEITENDRSFFSADKLAAGWRLSCCAYPTSDLTISIDVHSEESDFDILSVNASNAKNPPVSSLALAIDIGTTTIAAALVDTADGRVAGTASCINRQRMYGADVISRIKAASEGHLHELQMLILEDLCRLIRQFDNSNITQLVIGANTTMTHLLMGYPCETLGSYPFTPYRTGTITLTARELFGNDIFEDINISDCPVTIFPEISAFVGGDIVSGIYAARLAETKDLSFLVDLGTNGEIVLGNCDKLLVTSTAAGPAFEGGNISCGTGSIRGAVSHVDIVGGRPIISLIGSPTARTRSQSPCGICGTGVVAVTSALLRQGLIDKNGTFIEKYRGGYPFAQAADGEPLLFTQADVREIQLAKAAICAGMETLMLRCGVTADDIAHVYIAGGFGQKLNTRAALSIGLLPKAFSNRIEMTGNSCLTGAIRLLTDMTNGENSSNILSSLSAITKKSAEISLSTDPDFQNLYLAAMSFPT